ncbi:hypothetical protein ACFQI7_11805 [Paenibacillus allorhizosphaerae]|uniref:Nucleotidyl transferase AbiEii/AbiGii toxin family protein n=1 Tax=Paenibacillus allorhizosphaerae TaxID=2849866 RepID=A0ABM8VH90_9BACL|nr:hypothetical protein [Paenibacillus allorhizosphaerae]CAG7641304.1 hypothetical protein PAECIP111802_02726 [Paenibacillus allorhizosphaerae]
MTNFIHTPLSESLLAALKTIREQSGGHRPLTWLVGGSTGLMLQGVSLAAPPRDLDLYIDREQAAEMHEALKPYAVDEQAESETALYRSILSHYDIGGVKVELVGAFEVRALESEYKVEAAYLSQLQAPWLTQPGLESVRIMPLMHELIFNVLRARPDRYEAIADLCRRQDTAIHRLMLERLASRNRFSAALTDTLERLLNESNREPR